MTIEEAYKQLKADPSLRLEARIVKDTWIAVRSIKKTGQKCYPYTIKSSVSFKGSVSPDVNITATVDGWPDIVRAAELRDSNG